MFGWLSHTFLCMFYWCARYGARILVVLGPLLPWEWEMFQFFGDFSAPLRMRASKPHTDTPASSRRMFCCMGPVCMPYGRALKVIFVCFYTCGDPFSFLVISWGTYSVRLDKKKAAVFMAFFWGFFGARSSEGLGTWHTRLRHRNTCFSVWGGRAHP